MNTLLTKNIDRASEFIITLQAIIRKLTLSKGYEPGLLQQFLDDESLYIKQVPRDNLNVFRCLADVSIFLIGQPQKLLNNYINHLRKNIYVLLKFDKFMNRVMNCLAF